MDSIKDIDKIKTISDLSKTIKKDETLLKAMQNNPTEVIDRLNNIVGKPTGSIYKIAVIALALVACLSVAGIIFLGVTGKEIPGGLETIVGSAVGGLVGLLTPIPE